MSASQLPLRVIPTSPPGEHQYAWNPPVEAAAVPAEKTARRLAKLEAEDRAYHDRQHEAGALRGGGSHGVDRSQHRPSVRGCECAKAEMPKYFCQVL